jgi:hypothetical protein
MQITASLCRLLQLHAGRTRCAGEKRKLAKVRDDEHWRDRGGRKRGVAQDRA